MGEEKKKSEDNKKVEEEKPKAKEEAKKGEEEAKEEKKDGNGGGGGEEKKEEEVKPPEEVVMRVYMHCEGCARKVKKSLKGFEGVDEVSADSKAHKVIVKGKKAAEQPMKLVERVQKKTGRKVELLSPLPPPKGEDKKKEDKKEEEEKPKPEDKKEPEVVTVVLKVHMHCEACAQEIKKRMLKMKGVQSAEPELKSSQVTVKGVFEAAKLVEYVNKRTGKHATIVKSETNAVNAVDGDAKDDKKDGDKKDEKEKDGNAGGEEKEKDGDGADDKEKDKDGAAIAAANLYVHYPRFAYAPGYNVGYAYPPYPPQIFSDENPNACSVM